MKKLSLYLLVILMIPFFATCNKKSDDPAPVVPNNTVNNPTNTNVCTGNGGTSYYPLEKNNEWISSISSFGTTETITTKIIDTVTTSGKKWYEERVSSSIIGSTNDDYYYYVNTNGDIYKSYQKDTDYSVLWIPANPVVGQGWRTFNNSYAYDSLNIASTNATITIGSCTYTNVLVINQYWTGDKLLNGKFYYKKGIGLLRNHGYYSGNSTGAVDIKSLKLK